VTKVEQKYGANTKLKFTSKKNANSYIDVAIEDIFSIAFRNLSNYTNNTSMNALTDVASNW
jgi:hypothetical protein